MNTLYVCSATTQEKFETYSSVAKIHQWTKFAWATPNLSLPLRRGVTKNVVPLFLWEIFYLLESPDTEK